MGKKEAKTKKAAAKKAAKAKKAAAKKAKKATKKAKPSKKVKVLKKAKKPVKKAKKVKKLIEIVPDLSSVVAVAFVGALSCGAVALTMILVRRTTAEGHRRPRKLHPSLSLSERL